MQKTFHVQKHCATWWWVNCKQLSCQKHKSQCFPTLEMFVNLILAVFIPPPCHHVHLFPFTRLVAKYLYSIFGRVQKFLHLLSVDNMAGKCLSCHIMIYYFADNNVHTEQLHTRLIPLSSFNAH